MLHQHIDLEIAEREAWALRRQRGIPNNRRLWVLACMDERLPVNEALGIREGDAHVFRNAGGLVTDDAARIPAWARWSTRPKRWVRRDDSAAPPGR